MDDNENNFENKRPKKLFYNEYEKPLSIPKKLFKNDNEEYFQDIDDNIYDSYDGIIKEENNNEQEIEELYNFNKQNYPIPTISTDELNDCVKKVGVGQKKLETIVLQNNSKVYKYCNLAYNEIKYYL